MYVCFQNSVNHRCVRGSVTAYVCQLDASPLATPLNVPSTSCSCCDVNVQLDWSHHTIQELIRVRLSLCLLVRVAGGLEQIPAVIVPDEGSTLDWSPVNSSQLLTDKRQRQRKPFSILCAIFHIILFFLILWALFHIVYFSYSGMGATVACLISLQGSIKYSWFWVCYFTNLHQITWRQIETLATTQNLSLVAFRTHKHNYSSMQQ